MRKSPYLLLALITTSLFIFASNINAIGQMYALEVADDEIFAYKLTANTSSSIYSRFIMQQQEEVTINTNNYTTVNGTFQIYENSVWKNQSRFTIPSDPVLDTFPIAFEYLSAFNSSGIAPEIGYPFILPSNALISLDTVIENANNAYANHNLTVQIIQNVNHITVGYDTNYTTNMTMEWDSLNGVMTYFNYVTTINNASYHYSLEYIQKPIVEKSSDLTFTKGSTGNILIWNITVQEILLIHYDLYIGDELWFASPLPASSFTEEGWISIYGNFDTLLNGTYTVRFILYDGFGYVIETINTIVVNPASTEPDITPYIIAGIVIGAIAVIFIYIAIRARRQNASTITEETRTFCVQNPASPMCIDLRNRGKL